MQSASQELELYNLLRINNLCYCLKDLKSYPESKSDIITLLELLFKESNGFQLSSGFRAPQFVYGELLNFDEYLSVFSHSSNLKNSNSIFCDLGSGVGKANLLVATCFNIHKSVGIEYINRLTQYSNSRKRLLSNTFSKYKKALPEIEFIRGDILKCQENWKNADVFFINCVCWEQKMMRRLLSAFENLKIGSEIFSTNPLNRKNLCLVEQILCKAGWSDTKIYLYTIKPTNPN